MANKDNPGNSPKQPLKEDSLVNYLSPEAETPKPIIQLSGWLGRGTEQGTWNLYVTPKLDQYIQFSEQDVVHSQPISADQSPLGGTVVWLRDGAPVRHVTVAALQAEADFLSGGIASTYLAGAISSLPTLRTGRALAAIGTGGVNCSVNPHIPACRPYSENCYQTKVYPCSLEPIYCTTNNAFCPTREFVC
jgi:hypothetical protein